MKKLVLLILTFCLMLTLVACGEEKASDGPEKMDIPAVYTKLTEAVQIPEMLELNEDLMLDYCGIKSANVKQAVVVICADSLRTDEIWLIEATNESAAKDIVKLAEKRLQKKGEESITYSPEQYAVVEKAELIHAGRFVALLVSPDSAQLAEVFKAEAGI